MTLLSTYQKGQTVDQTILEDLPRLTSKSIIQTIPNSETSTSSPIFCSEHNLKHGITTQLHPQIETIVDLFEYALLETPDARLWGHVPPQGAGTPVDYQFITFKEARDMINHLGSAIVGLIAEYQLDTCPILTIYSHNRYEWSLVDYVGQYNSMPTVALYDTLGVDATRHILHVTESPIIFTVNTKIEHLVELVKLNALKLKVIVSMDSKIPSSLIELCLSNGIFLTTIPKLIQRGKQYPMANKLPIPSTVATITFTSGTSALPKGVVLTHANLIAALTYIPSILPTKLLEIKGQVRYYAMLPLAHIMERLDLYGVMYYSTCIYYPSDGTDPKKSMDDLKLVRPHAFVTVPRVLIKIESAVKTKLEEESGLKIALLKRAINYKMNAYKQKGSTEFNPSHWIYDYVLSGFRKKIGFENMLFIAVGSASLPANTSLFMKALLNFNNLQVGYGLTETCGVVCLNSGNDVMENNVGIPGLTTQFRIEDKPDLDYVYSKNKCGELLIRGSHVFGEYFKDPEATKESFTEDGFFKTGDIVRLSKEGNFQIIDRAKNFFKLNQGEFISPEKIENEYLDLFSEWFTQVWIVGSADQAYPLGFFCVDKSKIIKFIEQNNISFQESTLPILINTVEFKTKFYQQVIQPTPLTKLKGFEKIQNFNLYLEEFLSLDNDTLTTTMKVRRHKAKQVYKDSIEILYKEGPLRSGNKRLSNTSGFTGI